MSKSKVALITGITGQDGAYLAEFLLRKGYEVHGIIRRTSTFTTGRIDHLYTNPDIYGKKLFLHYGDLADAVHMTKLIYDLKPDEIYNLAAQSHVRVSYDIPQFTVSTNSLGVLNILEAYKSVCPQAKFYQASSSEMFGSSVDEDGFQRESTKMTPVSPYGCAKVFGYNIVRNYRNAYKLHASNGILFNHESPRRGSNFVTNKVVKTAVEIYLGQRRDLVLGNLDAYRDWGHSKDYVTAMHLILQQPQAGDWVVATGETRSVRDMCEYVFGRLGMNYQDHVKQDTKFLRPEELPYLKGDSSRIRALGWEPEYTFEGMMNEMIDYHLKTLSRVV
jgi:GDPmannose 4,6-dehydratase